MRRSRSNLGLGIHRRRRRWRGPSVVRPTLDLVSASDTGVSPTDNITSDDEPTFEIGPIFEGDVVRLYLNEILHATYTITAADVVAGAFTIPGAPLPEGAHSVTVTRDDGVESAHSIPLSVSIDITSPTLSDAQAAGTNDNEADVQFTTTESNGKIYWVITTSATDPTAAQVIAGTDHADVAATASDSFDVISSGVKTDHTTGLLPSTNYWLYGVHEDLAGNRSAVVSSASWTTNVVVDNLLANPEAFNLWTLTSVTVTADAETNAVGAAIADQVKTAGATDANRGISQIVTAIPGATQHTFSVYLKIAGSRQWVRLAVGDTALASVTLNAWFDVLNGVLGTVNAGLAAAISDAGSGWKRCSVTFTTDADGGQLSTLLRAANANNGTTSGTGTVGDVYFIADRAMLNAGALTGYVP